MRKRSAALEQRLYIVRVQMDYIRHGSDNFLKCLDTQERIEKLLKGRSLTAAERAELTEYLEDLGYIISAKRCVMRWRAGL